MIIIVIIIIIRNRKWRETKKGQIRRGSSKRINPLFKCFANEQSLHADD